MDKILDYLAEVEGVVVHYLDGEKDITLPYGIYTHDHPNTELGLFVSKVAQKLDLNKKTSQYTISDLYALNIALKPYEDKVRELASRFYKDFIKGAHIDLFPEECRVAMYSMYTNSPRRAWSAVQEAIIEFDNIYMFKNELPRKQLSNTKGAFGQLTSDSLDYITHLLGGQGYHFEARMLSNMKSLYIKLALSNPEKYMKYLKGWDNRMSHLEMLR